MTNPRIMNQTNNRKGAKLLTKLAIGASLGVVAFVLLKGEKPIFKQTKHPFRQNKEQLFI